MVAAGWDGWSRVCPVRKEEAVQICGSFVDQAFPSQSHGIPVLPPALHLEIQQGRSEPCRCLLVQVDLCEMDQPSAAGG